MAQVWLITGSARGLGRAIAEGVLAADGKLIATARNPQQLFDLVERYSDNERAVALNVTDERAAIAAVCREGEGLEGLRTGVMLTPRHSPNVSYRPGPSGARLALVHAYE